MKYLQGIIKEIFGWIWLLSDMGSWSKGSQFWDFTRPGAVWTFFGDVFCDDPPCGKWNSHIDTHLHPTHTCIQHKHASKHTCIRHTLAPDTHMHQTHTCTRHTHTSHSAYVATETELVGAKIDGLLPPNFL